MNNILILISKGPNYFSLFKNIGDYYTLKNKNVFYAIESHYIDYEYNKGKPLSYENSFYFSDYLNLHKNISINSIIKDYKDINLYETLISDYNRYVTHHKLWNKREGHLEKLIQMISFYEEIIDKYDIDTIIHECAANEFAHIAYLVSKKKHIKYVGLQSARIPARLEIHDGPNGIIFNKNIDSSEIKDEDREIVRNFVKGVKNITPFYMKSKFNPANVNYVKEYATTRKISKIINILKYRIKYSSTIKNEFGSEKPIKLSLALFKREFKRYIKVKKIDKIYDSVNTQEEFYIYPMHYEPEASVSVWAKFYIDQINFIRTIAFQLPFGKYLYVKDHKSSKGLLSPDFYKEIKLIPNVRFISPEIDSKELAMNSLGIITLTSTLGFESLAMRKRVYVFGDVFFDKHPYVVKIPHYRDLFGLLQKDIAVPPIYKEEYDDFFLTYYINTYPGKFDVYNQTDELYENIYQAIEDYVKY